MTRDEIMRLSGRDLDVQVDTEAQAICRAVLCDVAGV